MLPNIINIVIYRLLDFQIKTFGEFYGAKSVMLDILDVCLANLLFYNFTFNILFSTLRNQYLAGFRQHSN